MIPNYYNLYKIFFERLIKILIANINNRNLIIFFIKDELF